MKIMPFQGTVMASGIIATLSGCYIERDLETTPRLMPSVRRMTFSEHIPFGQHHHSLSSREVARLQKLIHRASQPGPIYARLVVRKLQARFDDPMTDPRITCMVRFLEQAGVESHRIDIIEADRGIGSGLWLAIDQYVPVLPQCPGFDTQVMDGRVPPEGETHFSCSTESNFTAMIAEPKDLYKGHPLSSGDPVVNANAINRLRTDKVKTLKIEQIGTTNNTTAPAAP